MSDETIGLTAGGKTVPLTAVKIAAVLNGTAARVTVTQRYENQRKKPIEALYVFPLEEGAAITAFAATIGDRTVRAELRPREEAFVAYDEAMSKGHGAYLLEQQRANRFSASIGNLPPGASVEVTLSYVAELKIDRDGIRFMLPTTLTPRYTPARKEREDVEPTFAAQTPYRLTIDVTVEQADQLEVIESPSHPIAVELRDGRAVVRFSAADVQLDRDVVIRLKPRSAEPASVLRAVGSDGVETLMLAFHPQLPPAPNVARELAFVIDCSGSMSGESIVAARRAVELCLRAMSSSDSFNICRFGSNFDLLWPSAQPYNAATLNAALEHLAVTEADLGGTEILEPLRALTAQPLPTGVRRRDLLVLTDGAVSNEEEVLELARAQRGTTRIFSFGIGTASDLLVRGLARNSGGAAEFVSYRERIEPAVLRMFGRLNDPQIDDLHIDWGGLKVEQSPIELPALYSGDRLTVYARISGGSAGQVTLQSATGAWTAVLPPTAVREDQPLLAALWARSMIRDIEEGGAVSAGSHQRRRSVEKRQTARLRELSLAYGILCRETAYVAIEERSEDNRTTRSVFLQVENQVPAGMALSSPPPMPMSGRVRAMAAPLSVADSGLVYSMSRYQLSSPPSSPAPMARKATVRGRRAASAAPSHSGSGDRLIDLLLLQQFDGSFKLDDVLPLLTEIADGLQALAATHSPELVATLAVLTFCAQSSADREAEWRSAAAKAEQWVSTQADASALRAQIRGLFA